MKQLPESMNITLPTANIRNHHPSPSTMSVTETVAASVKLLLLQSIHKPAFALNHVRVTKTVTASLKLFQSGHTTSLHPKPCQSFKLLLLHWNCYCFRQSIQPAFTLNHIRVTETVTASPKLLLLQSVQTTSLHPSHIRVTGNITASVWEHRNCPQSRARRELLKMCIASVHKCWTAKSP